MLEMTPKDPHSGLRNPAVDICGLSHRVSTCFNHQRLQDFPTIHFFLVNYVNSCRIRRTPPWIWGHYQPHVDRGTVHWNSKKGHGWVNGNSGVLGVFWVASSKNGGPMGCETWWNMVVQCSSSIKYVDWTNDNGIWCGIWSDILHVKPATAMFKTQIFVTHWFWAHQNLGICGHYVSIIIGWQITTGKWAYGSNPLVDTFGEMNRTRPAMLMFTMGYKMVQGLNCGAPR
jgi:hypothetical protein